MGGGRAARALVGLGLLVLGAFLLVFGASGIEYSGDLLTSLWVVGAGVGLAYGGLVFLTGAVRPR